MLRTPQAQEKPSWCILDGNREAKKEITVESSKTIQI
jgi:hypothetical protein